MTPRTSERGAEASRGTRQLYPTSSRGHGSDLVKLGGFGKVTGMTASPPRPWCWPLTMLALLVSLAVGPDANAEKARLVPSNKHMRVRTRSLRLTRKARDRLLRIAKRYHEATGRRLVITGGTRTPLRQAQLMHQKLEHGEDLFKLYPAGPVRPIIAAYKKAKRRKKSKLTRIANMRLVIEKQMKRRVFVSKHLQAGAADVRSRNMNAKRFRAFVKAVRAEPGVVLLDERRAAQPHLHLSLL